MNLFINQGRLRAGWRLLIHTLMVLLFTFLVGIPLFLFIGDVESVTTTPSADSYLEVGNRWLLVSELSFAFGLTLATYIARRWLDKRSFASLGIAITRWTVFDLFVGILIAGLIMGVIFCVELAIGWLRIDGFAWQLEEQSQFWKEVALIALLFILVGWTEELLSRGYHLQNLADGLNIPAGVVLSSLIFAILHQSNPSFTWRAFLGLFIAGLFFCFAYYQFGNLWVPIGLHIGWNFFEGVVFGFQVSGLYNLPKLILQTVSGPEWITGGAFGPEAGFVLIAGLLVGVPLLWFYRRLRDTKAA
ncbi:MAG: type II CAAX endopeptidase family protein [Anaerolineales bacterium]